MVQAHARTHKNGLQPRALALPILKTLTIDQHNYHNDTLSQGRGVSISVRLYKNTRYTQLKKRALLALMTPPLLVRDIETNDTA
jgi:hypothetical protein